MAHISIPNSMQCPYFFPIIFKFRPNLGPTHRIFPPENNAPKRLKYKEKCTDYLEGFPPKSFSTVWGERSGTPHSTEPCRRCRGVGTLEVECRPAGYESKAPYHSATCSHSEGCPSGNHFRIRNIFCFESLWILFQETELNWTKKVWLREAAKEII